MRPTKQPSQNHPHRIELPANISEFLDDSRSQGEQNQQRNLPACCAKVQTENQLLRRALRKERERRQLAEWSTDILLESYRKLLGLKSTHSLPPTSTISLVESEQQPSHQKQRQTAPTENGGSSKSIPRRDYVTLTDATGMSSVVLDFERKLQFNGRSRAVDDKRAPPAPVRIHLSPSPPKKRTPLTDNTGSILNRQKLQVEIATQTREPQQQNKETATEGGAGSETRKASSGKKRRIRKQPSQKQQKIMNNEKNTGEARQNWYFVSLDEKSGQQKAEFAQRKLQMLLSNSRARHQAIMDASRQRAALVANRRAVMHDLLYGRRELDQDALRVIKTDSSHISAFPQFMRHMRASSKRQFEKSQFRHQQELDRQKLYERASNRVFAHTAATIAKSRDRIQSASSAL